MWGERTFLVGFFRSERGAVLFGVRVGILKADRRGLVRKFENDTMMGRTGYKEEESCSEGTSR